MNHWMAACKGRTNALARIVSLVLTAHISSDPIYPTRCKPEARTNPHLHPHAHHLAVGRYLFLDDRRVLFRHQLAYLCRREAGLRSHEQRLVEHLRASAQKASSPVRRAGVRALGVQASTACAYTSADAIERKSSQVKTSRV